MRWLQSHKLNREIVTTNCFSFWGPVLARPVPLLIFLGNKKKPPAMQVCSQTALASSKKPPCYNEYKVRQPNHYNKEESKWTIIVYHTQNGHANII